MAWSQFGEFINKNRGPLGNLGTGLATGWGTQGQQRGTYVPMANWVGNGIARTGLQYIPNDNYVNTFDALNAGIAQKGMRGKDSNNGFNFDRANNMANYQLQNVYGKLAGLKGKVGQFFHNAWGNIVNRRFGNRGDLDISLPNYNAYGETIA